MKNEETSRETPRDNAEGKKAYHPAIGGFASSGSNSAIRNPHSAFLSAFTLIELMIAVAIFGLVMSGAIGVYIMCQKMWHATSLSMQTNRDVNLAMSRLIYGTGSNSGLRAAATITISSNVNGWRMACSNKFDGAKSIDFNNQASNIYWVDGVNQSSLVCDHVSSAVVSTNTSGVNIQLTMLRKEGRFTSTNQISTFVIMRNRK